MGLSPGLSRPQFMQPQDPQPTPHVPGLSDRLQGQCGSWTTPSTWACGLGGLGGGSQRRVRPTCRARRAAKEAKEAPAQPAPEKVKVEVKKFVKIGRPGYKGDSV